MASENDSEDIDIPELDEVIFKQIENFKPISKLKNAVNAADFSKEDGAVIEFNEVENGEEEEEKEGYYNPLDYLEIQEEDEEEMYIQHAPSQKIEDITGDGGVKKSTTKFGIGPIVSGNALCRIHYSAYLSGEVEPFDSTRMRNSHARIRIGSHGNGLRGLQIAISTMRKNEEAKFFIHPDYAYGELGVPPRIPGNATVIFEVEMVSFVNEAEDFDDGDVDDAERRSWRKIFNKLDPLHHEANDLYHHGDYRRAIKVYGKSIRIARDAALYSQEDEDQMNDFSAKMFLNVALCSLKLGNYKNTISMCKRVLSLKPDELKAFFRLAQAHRLNANYVKAKKFILIAKAKSQVNSDILEELAALSRDIQKYESSMKTMCQAMLNISSEDRDKTDSIKKECQDLSQDLKEINENLSNMLDEKFKSFSEDSSTQKIVLPNQYLKDELCTIKNLARKYNILLDIDKRRIILNKSVDN